MAAAVTAAAPAPALRLIEQEEEEKEKGAKEHSEEGEQAFPPPRSIVPYARCVSPVCAVYS